MKPAVFFDRDNTLIACDEYLGEADKVVLVSGAADAVARAKQLGFAVVTVSNQSGVARGYFNEDAVRAVDARLDELLRHANPQATIDRHEFCPFHPEASIERYRRANSPMRKPAPGMLYAAAEALDLDLKKSWLIGDAPRDIEAGEAAGCRTILFLDPSLKTSPDAATPRRVEPGYICSTLAEAMDFIEKNSERNMDELPDDQPNEATPSESDAKAQAAGGETMKSSADELGDAQLPVDETPKRVDLLEPADPSEDETIQQDPAPSSADQGAGMAVTPRRPWLEAAAQARRPSPSISTEQPVADSQSPPAEPPGATSKLEVVAGEILHELKRQREQPVSEFSVSKLLGGVLQMIVLFVLFIAYFSRSEPQSLQTMLLLALVLQAMTIALLIMGKQK